MQPQFGQPSEPSESAPAVYTLPLGDDAVCLFEVAPALARCIGLYARIPEFARDGHMLQISRLVSGQTG
jgi:hypothetical protein